MSKLASRSCIKMHSHRFYKKKKHLIQIRCGSSWPETHPAVSSGSASFNPMFCKPHVAFVSTGWLIATRPQQLFQPESFLQPLPRLSRCFLIILRQRKRLGKALGLHGRKLLLAKRLPCFVKPWLRISPDSYQTKPPKEEESAGAQMMTQTRTCSCPAIIRNCTRSVSCHISTPKSLTA